MNIGIIGAGMIGQKHIENILLDGRAQIAWVCTMPFSAAKNLQEHYVIPHCTTDYRDVLNDSTVDCVIIATPPQFHAEQAVAAIKAGKHVLIEKPLALTIADVQKIADTAREYPERIVLSAAARHSRMQPKFSFIKKIIDERRIGTVYHIHHQVLRRGKRYGIEYNPEATWSLSRAHAGGGPFLDWGVYDLSFHLGLFQDQLKLEQVLSATYNGTDDAREAFPDFDVEEHGVALMRFTSGISYYYERSTNTHLERPNQTIIHGSEGALSFDYLSWGSPVVSVTESMRDRTKAPRVEELTVPIPADFDDHKAIIEHFIDCVVEGETPLLTPSQELTHYEIIHSLVEAPPRYLRD